MNSVMMNTTKPSDMTVMLPNGRIRLAGQMANRDEQAVETYHYEPEKQVKRGLRRAAAYCRVSTLTDDQEYSFESQVSFYTEMIRRDPTLTLVGIYADQGFSGLNMSRRKEFRRLIDDCEAGKIDVIYVKSVSRFSRNAAEGLEVIKRLNELGVQVLFEKEGLDSSDPATEMILNIYATMAQNESCSHSENLLWAHKHRAELGDPIRSPAPGYRIEKKPGDPFRYWVVDEEAAQPIRQIFSLAHQGYLLREIGQKMEMTTPRVKAILTNEAYRGDILTNKHVRLDYTSRKTVKNTGQREQVYLEGHHEPLVDPAVFDEIQEYIQSGVLSYGHSNRYESWLNEHPEILGRRKAQEPRKRRGRKPTVKQ